MCGLRIRPYACMRSVPGKLRARSRGQTEYPIMRTAAMHAEANLWSLVNPRTDADSELYVFVVILFYPVLITRIVIFMAKVTKLWNYAYVFRAS